MTTLKETISTFERHHELDEENRAHKPGGSAEMNQKPPLGLKPKLVHDEQRLFEVSGAIGRYFIAGLPIPVEWVEEYNQLVKSLKGAVST